MIGVTGASGHLGRLAVAALLERGTPAGEIVALVRDPAKVADLAAQGVVTRAFDYEAASPAALAGVDKLLLVSSSEVGRRLPQHQNVIAAAKQAGVGLIAYTSILRADSSPIELAVEHRATEAALKASGLPTILLRNGWYSENYEGSIAAGPAHGAIIGAEGTGRINSATRADYAAAAAAALTGAARAGDVLELAGDEGWTMADLAATIAKASGKPVAYQQLPEDAYRGALEGLGLPGPFAAILAQASAATATGALADDSHTLSRLIGHPTTPVAETVAAVLAGGAGDSH